MNKHREKIRNDLKKLKPMERLGYLLKNPLHRLSAYNSAKKLGIQIIIRESISEDGFEVIRIR